MSLRTLNSPLFPYTTLFRSTIDPDTRMIVVPSSEVVKKQAENEGLDKIFLKFGAEWRTAGCSRSEEHTSELQSRGHLVCRLLLEKKNNNITIIFILIHIT